MKKNILHKLSFLCLIVLSSSSLLFSQDLRIPGQFICEDNSINEINAISMLNSSEFYLRMDGIKFILPYKSDKNVKSLITLLEDKWFYIYGSKKVKKRFPVRFLAYKTLKQWHINIPAPVIEELIPAGK